MPESAKSRRLKRIPEPNILAKAGLYVIALVVLLSPFALIIGGATLAANLPKYGLYISLAFIAVPVVLIGFFGGIRGVAFLGVSGVFITIVGMAREDMTYSTGAITIVSCVAISYAGAVTRGLLDARRVKRQQALTAGATKSRSADSGDGGTAA